jgi:hypothetical protein
VVAQNRRAGWRSEAGRRWPQAGAQKGGRDTSDGSHNPGPQVHSAAGGRRVRQIFGELYPGEAVLENDVESGLVEPQRPYPFEDCRLAGGRRDVKDGGPLLRTPEDRPDGPLQDTRVFQNDVNTSHGHNASIAYQICGDHAFFYDDRDAKSGAAQLPRGPSRDRAEDRGADRGAHEAGRGRDASSRRWWSTAWTPSWTRSRRA